jgi:hypothetical protein
MTKALTSTSSGHQRMRDGLRLLWSITAGLHGRAPCNLPLQIPDRFP